MKNKRKKGFTLIELLAIIVILAIIAVITVPIILNVIDNAKKGSIKDSAYGYKDAINKFYVSEQLENSNLKLDGTYTIDNGKLGSYEISFTGTTPTSGYLTYQNNILTDGCITMDEYKVTVSDGEVTTVKKGECTSSVTSNFGGEVITSIPSTGHTGVKAIVYLDPTNLSTECNAELASANVNEDGSPIGIKSGCMKWYAFAEDDNTYTMILDHNTTARIYWITKEDYEQTGSQTVTPADVGIEYLNGLPAGTWYSYGTNNRGPITLLNQLKADTANWTVAETLTESDTYTAEWTGSNNYYSGIQHYTINYDKYNARLITAEEINEITGKGTNVLVTNIQVGYLDSNCSSLGNCTVGTNKYGWLFDYTGVGVPVGTPGAPSCTSYGCNAGNNFETFYWTSSPDVSTYVNALGVIYSNELHSYQVGDMSNFGLRPVISVSKSKLS